MGAKILSNGQMFMKRVICIGWLSLVSLTGVIAAPVDIFINSTALNVPPDTLPTVNATSFVNQSTFNVSSGFSFLGTGNGAVSIFQGFSFLPFETFNTRYFTNEASGQMFGSPGFRFLTTKIARNTKTRVPADWFVNDGEIGVSTYLEVKATNIVSTGPLDAGASGLIRLAGKNVSVNRTTLRTGNSPGVSLFGGDNFDAIRQYDSAPGVTDTYWAVGTNNSLDPATGPVRLNGFRPNFTLPFPTAPVHEVLQLFLRRSFTNSVFLPKFRSFGHDAFAYTNSYFGTATIVQVAFVPTNSYFGTDSNYQAEVRFSDGSIFGGTGSGAADVLVRMSSVDFDLVTGTFTTNSVYLADHMATRTNASLYRPFQFATGTPVGATRRPSVYEVFRTEPFEFNSFFSVPPNTPFTNGMIWNPSFVSNSVTMRYAAYGANISAVGLSNANNILGPTVVGGPSLTGANSPTNLPGRVEIFSDKLDMDLTRIRSESTIVIKTKDLSSNQVARVDAPYLSFDLASKQPEFTVTNLAPSDVRRFFGPLCAWSGFWKNSVVDTNGLTPTTNDVFVHVLFVDHALQSLVPVQVFECFLHGTNLVIQDRLNVSKAILLDAKSLDVQGAINFPPGASWAKTNVPVLVNFTNRGSINIPGAGRYGTDRQLVYSNFVNWGTNAAGAQFIRARYLENSGCLGSGNGPMSVNAVTLQLEGRPVEYVTNQVEVLSIDPTSIGGTNFIIITNIVTQIITNSTGAKFSSSGDMSIFAGDMRMSNAVLIAGGVTPGRLIFTVTNSLVDGGSNGLGDWTCTAGFEMRRRPNTSDLLGTTLRTVSAPNRRVNHVWAGIDRGTNVSGFSNNLALGKLVIDAGAQSLMQFRPASGTAAIYVDYLELLNFATNSARIGYLNESIFSIDPRMTIYFANSNLEVDKLDGAGGGRFRWVPSYTGRLSSTNITYPSGTNYTFNTAVVTSHEMDSDNDGCANFEDSTPIPVPGDTVQIPCDRLFPSAIARASGARPTAGVAVSAAVNASATRSSAVMTDASLVLNISRATGGTPSVRLNWQAPADSEVVVEFKDGWDGEWQTLTSVVTKSGVQTATMTDPIPSAVKLRLYRLRLGAPTPR
jgi:hypothetical protein